VTAVILSAAANGFGPASKVVAIAQRLRGFERIFVGEQIAQVFCERNANNFERIVSRAQLEHADTPIWHAQFGVIVMEHDIALTLFKAQIPYFFFDSLLEFWALPKGVSHVAGVARSMLAGPDRTQADLSYAQLSVHERKVLCHFLAQRSFAQIYPGVERRLIEMKRCGLGDVSLVGPIVGSLDQFQSGDLPTQASTARRRNTILINLGGVRNFIIEFGKNDYYIALMEQWARRYLEAHAVDTDITICCGRYQALRETPIQQNTLTRTFLSHESFMAAASRADVVLSAPGRTFIHEAIQLGIVPVLLPEQHRSQAANLAGLLQSPLAHFCVSLDHVYPGDPISEDDYAGSTEIIDRSRAIATTPALFVRFDSILRDRIDRLRSLSVGKRSEIIAQMRATLKGPPLDDVLFDILHRDMTERG
jgi:hypothetical protein